MSNEAIITIILTIVFGVPSLVALAQSLPAKFILVLDEKIDIYKELGSTFKNLQVVYEGNVLDKDYFLYKGCFFYNGRTDIVKEQINKSIYIEIPEGSIWHEYKIIQASKDLAVDLRLDNNKLLFDFDLLKSEDYFYFQILAKINNVKKEEDHFITSHRIANVKKEVKEVNSKEYSNNLFYLFLFLLMLITGIWSIYTSIKIDIDMMGYKKPDVIFYYKNKQVDRRVIDSLYKISQTYKIRLDDGTYSKELIAHPSSSIYFTKTTLQEKAKDIISVSDYLFERDVKHYKVDSDLYVKFIVHRELDTFTIIAIIICIFCLFAIIYYFTSYYRQNWAISKFRKIKI